MKNKKSPHVMCGLFKFVDKAKAYAALLTSE